MLRRTIPICLVLLGSVMLPLFAHGSAALLLEEPYGTFGYLNPTGHAAIYLSSVCADTPTQLRRCREGEPGVVISRYHHVAGYDWLAIPLVPYLYAVDATAKIPSVMSALLETELRDSYRRQYLETVAPDGKDGRTPAGEWPQLVGALYDRKIFVYQFETTAASDDRLIARLNERPNRSHFNLLFHNCADMSRMILNFYYPHSIHRNVTADLGLTTPKQLARSLRQYGARHEGLNLRMYVLPQVNGTIGRSKPVDGVIESFLKTKYVVPVAIFQPIVAAGLATDYLVRGRFNPGQNAIALENGDEVSTLVAGREMPSERLDAGELPVSQSSLDAGTTLHSSKPTTEDGSSNMLPFPALAGNE